MESDHESLHLLLTRLDAELAATNFEAAVHLLDMFWARLAMHIRAENLHLFPALANRANHLGQDCSLGTAANEVVSQLQDDHDYFMKELATLMKMLRAVSQNEAAKGGALERTQQSLTALKQRLERHNQLEENQVYSWPEMILDEEAIADLNRRVQHELENLPPRFSS